MEGPSLVSESSSVSRRMFLQSAAAASLTLATSHASAQKKITDGRVIRTGLIGRDGHYDILLNSVPRLKNVEWTAYAKGESGEDTAWVRKQRAWTQKTRVYEYYQEMLQKERLDVVGVCLPFYQNAGAATEACGRGIN